MRIRIEKMHDLRLEGAKINGASVQTPSVLQWTQIPLLAKVRSMRKLCQQMA